MNTETRNEMNTYSRARLSFVARQRAPRVRAVSIETNTPDGFVHIKLECGHTSRAANHFDHRVGDSRECFECGEAIALKLPEFVGAEPDNT